MTNKKWISEISSGEHDVLMAGSDRTVYVYDSRTWKAKLKWKSPCKYDIVKLLPTASSPIIYVIGSDNEVMLCDILSSSVYAPPPKEQGLGNTMSETNAGLFFILISI